MVRQRYLIRQIADVNTPDGEHQGHANAKLIAAAPLLLDVSIEALAYIRQTTDHARLEQQLVAAIAKAQGGDCNAE